jgi:hypothetical protein
MSRVGVPAFSVSMLLLGMFIEVMAQSIQGTAWNAVELYGKTVTPRSGAGDRPHLVFGADGRMSGADGEWHRVRKDRGKRDGVFEQ